MLNWLGLPDYKILSINYNKNIQQTGKIDIEKLTTGGADVGILTCLNNNNNNNCFTALCLTCLNLPKWLASWDLYWDLVQATCNRQLICFSLVHSCSLWIVNKSKNVTQGTLQISDSCSFFIKLHLLVILIIFIRHVRGFLTITALYKSIYLLTYLAASDSKYNE